MDDISQTERVERYIADRLTPAERQAFETDLAQDPGLRQHYEEAQLVQMAAQQYALREEVRSIRQAMLTEIQPSAPVVNIQEHATENQPNHRTNPFNYAGRIAAGIALLLVGFLGFQYATLSGEALFNERAVVYSLTANRSAETPERLPEEQLKQQYRSAHFAEVVDTYERLSAPSLEATFLAGNAYLQQSQGESAAQAFQKVTSASSSQEINRFEEDAQYYLALSYLQTGEVDQALPILEAIRDNPQHSYHKSVSSYYLWRVRFLSYIK